MGSRLTSPLSKAAGGIAAFDEAPSQRLAFRFGFCAIQSDALGDARASALRARDWYERRIGWLSLWTHPEAIVQIVDAAPRRFVFIGDVYSRSGGALAERVAAITDEDDALFDLLDDLSGRFALILVEGNRARVFHDPIGSRSIFYHDRAPFAVASHAFVLAAAVGAAECPDLAAYAAKRIFRRRKTNALPGDRTVFRNVLALVPNNLFDSESLTTQRYWPRTPRRPSSQKEFFAAVDGSLAALARHVHGRQVPIFGLTGGVDTRAAIAGFRSLGIPFETVTWDRDTISARESSIVDRLNAALRVPHIDVMKLSDPVTLREETLANSGGLRSSWTAAVAIHPAFVNRPDTIFMRGWGAELMRGFYNLMPFEMADLTPEEMARAYYDPHNHREPPAGTVAFFEEYFRRGNYAGVEVHGYDPNDLFYWEHRMGMWGAMVHNEFDVSIRSLVCFNCRHLFATALGLPAEIRLTKHLLLEYVARHDPKLAAIPLDRHKSAAVAIQHRKTQSEAERSHPDIKTATVAQTNWKYRPDGTGNPLDRETAVAAPDDIASVATFGGLPRSLLAFRFGFLAVRSGSLGGDEIRALRNRNWVELTVGGIALWRQPDAVVQVFESEAATLVLVGEVYSETDADIGARIADLPSGRDDALYAFVSDLCGRFALLLIEGERVRVFNDPIGSRSIFYHERLPFAVASHALVLAAAIGAERCPEVAAYLADPASASRKTSCLPGDQTLYRHIHALVPNNLFDTEGMRTHRYWPRAARRDTNQEAFFAAADASLASLARHVRGRYTPILGSTGGVDTRAAMAALRSLETPFETVTWNRDTLSARESRIVDQLNAHLQTPHADLPRLKRTGRLGRVTTANGGGFRSPSSKAVAMHAALGERPDIIFLRGWGAEILRGFYNLLPTRMRDLTPSEMARMYFNPQGKRPPDGTTEFFEAYFSRGNYAGLEALGYDPNDLFYWEHRMGMWGALSLNEMDLGIRTLVCFNSRRLFEAAWGLPPEKRLTKDLLLDFVARHDPALAAMPLDRQRTAASKKKAVKPSEIAPRATERREHAGWLFHLQRRLRSAAGIRSADNRREDPE